MTCEPSTCSPEQGADCSPTSSSGTSQLPLLSGTDTPAESCASEPPRDGSPACTCTREMSGCSIHPLTPAEWISSQRASLARTLATPEIALAFRKVREAASGPKSSASLALFDPESCSLRTSQQSFLSDLDSTSSSLILPSWGSMRDGSVCELPMLERPIEGTDGGALLPTPLSRDHFPAHSEEYITKKLAQGHGMRNLNDRIAHPHLFPTPTQGDSKSSGSRNTATSKANAGVSLTDFVRQDGGAGRLWPTPHGFSKDGKSNGPSGNELGRAVNQRLWPTPSANNYEQADLDAMLDRRARLKAEGKNGNGFGLTLGNAVRMPTPSSNDWKGSSKDGPRRGQLTDPAMGVIPAGGSLNPTWVEWLMCWPLEWTKAMNIKPNSGRKAARKLTDRKTCERCQATAGLEVHHKDRDPTNNAPENREVLCQACHQQEHITAGDWGHGKVPTATCEICGVAFQPKRSRRATLCGSKECAKEKGKRSAAARWDGGTQSPTLAESPKES
jgi:hypothetical protein